MTLKVFDGSINVWSFKDNYEVLLSSSIADVLNVTLADMFLLSDTANDPYPGSS